MSRNRKNSGPKSSAPRNLKKRVSRNRHESQSVSGFEQLESRRLLAWVGFDDGVTLTLRQTLDHGDSVVDNSGPARAFRVTDNVGTLTFVPRQNIRIEMLSNTGNQMDFLINGAVPHPGNVEMVLNHGPRTVNFIGTLNRINGNVTVRSGDGPQIVNLSPRIPAPIVVGGSFTAELGDGFDTVYNNENFVTVNGNFSMVGVNMFRYTDFLIPPVNADLKVGGTLSMDTTNENTESFLVEGGTFHDPNPQLNRRSMIMGGFIYRGGDNIDHINLNHTFIGGNIDIDLGLGTPFFGDPQNVTTLYQIGLTGPLYFEALGNIAIRAGDSALGNVTRLEGIFAGNTVTYVGGNTVDEITYTLYGTQADVNAVMGGGNDKFTLKRFDFPDFPTVWDGVNVLDINFGNDSGDTFVNNYGKFTFDSDITRFHWFDHKYTVGDDRMNLVQLINTGNVTIDNNGGRSGIDWRVITPLGSPAATTQASNLVVDLLPNTGNNLYMDLDNPVLAFLTLNVGDGARNIEFIGLSNNPLRDLIITAGAGNQNVRLSVNAPLAVASLNVDLGAGFDSVFDDQNNLILTQDLIFRGVNHFENQGNLTVSRHVVIANDADNLDILFANNSFMFVGGNFTFFGGTRRDVLRLNGAGGTSITGTTTIDLGVNTGPGTQQVLLDNALNSFGLSLQVTSPNATTPDEFRLDPAAALGGNVRVDLGGGQNTALIVGVFNGFFVQYAGGSGVDDVTFGTTGGAAEFTATLGAGNDKLTLLATAVIAPKKLDVDFGGGVDTFINLYGPFNFDAALRNLNGWTHEFTLFSGNLLSTQVGGSPNVTFDDNGPGGAIRFTAADTMVIAPVTSLSIVMLDGSLTNLVVDLDNSLAGDLTVNLRAGNRTFNMSGSSNTIGGNLVITGTTGNQQVGLGVNNRLDVAGTGTFNLGTGTDVLDTNGRNVLIGGPVSMTGVNTFVNSATASFGGSFTFDSSADGVNTLLDNTGTLSVNGDFSYTGGTARDEVRLMGAGGSVISGFANIDLGDNTAGGAQVVSLNSPLTSIGGALTVRSTGATSPDSFLSHPGTSIGGDIDINLGSGQNDAAILGLFGGSSIKYNGGADTDTVTLGTTVGDADVNIKLGAGNDAFTLLAGTAIAPTLRVDFGGGVDTFDNQYGIFDFDARLLNWDGFDRFFTLATNNLNIIQRSGSAASVTLDNNGAGGVYRLLTPNVTEMTTAGSIRLEMLDGSTTNVVVDLDSALAGNLIMQLRNGARNVSFTGSSNSVGGLLRIEAGTGIQNFTLAINSNLNVGGNLVINGRTEADVVEDGAKNISVNGAMFLRGIQTFLLDRTLSVGTDFNWVSSLETLDSSFANRGTFSVGGNFSYLAGSGADEVLFNTGGVSITGMAVFSLAEGTGAFQQRVRLTGGFSAGALTIVGGSATFGNRVVTDGMTSIAGDVVVNFSGSTSDNWIFLYGNYGGTYSTYRGGAGIDRVTFGANAPAARFAGLLNGGNDVFTLKTGTALDELFVDFGAGTDSLIDEIGNPHPFPATFINL
jgi:hypothetical protein